LSKKKSKDARQLNVLSVNPYNEGKAVPAHFMKGYSYMGSRGTALLILKLGT